VISSTEERGPQYLGTCSSTLLCIIQKRQ